MHVLQKLTLTHRIQIDVQIARTKLGLSLASKLQQQYPIIFYMHCIIIMHVNYNNWGEPHTNQYYEKIAVLKYVYMYVCMYVYMYAAIHQPRIR